MEKYLVLIGKNSGAISMQLRKFSGNYSANEENFSRHTATDQHKSPH